ncbi:MAG TPA: DUF1570 domain-containing protein [Thermomonas sp.]|nr:DUF1570 domain-containing protein [Thermomonas sp.]
MPRWLLALATIAIAGLAAYGALRSRLQPQHQPTPMRAAKPGIIGIPAGAILVETPHYRIHSSASPEHAAAVGEALEALRAAYAGLFPVPEPAPKFAVVLYRDRAEFSRHNRSSPWAEAFYLDPACYAYFEVGARNPYHWALHEAVHQLARKGGSGFPRNRWIDEGLASYFSASELADGRLQLGTIDPTAYPAWWLTDASTTRGMPIPLEVLLSGEGGPEVDTHVNQYYLSAWSLTHFLMHHDNGRHAKAYRAFLEAGADRSAFARHVGPVETIEAAWLPYFRAQVAMANEPKH